jgi:hypothetical protein
VELLYEQADQAPPNYIDHIIYRHGLETQLEKTTAELIGWLSNWAPVVHQHQQLLNQTATAPITTAATAAARTARTATTTTPKQSQLHPQSQQQTHQQSQQQSPQQQQPQSVTTTVTTITSINQHYALSHWGLNFLSLGWAYCIPSGLISPRFYFILNEPNGNTRDDVWSEHWILGPNFPKRGLYCVSMMVGAGS